MREIDTGIHNGDLDATAVGDVRRCAYAAHSSGSDLWRRWCRRATARFAFGIVGSMRGLAGIDRMIRNDALYARFLRQCAQGIFVGNGDSDRVDDAVVVAQRRPMTPGGGGSRRPRRAALERNNVIVGL